MPAACFSYYASLPSVVTAMRMFSFSCFVLVATLSACSVRWFFLFHTSCCRFAVASAVSFASLFLPLLKACRFFRKKP